MSFLTSGSLALVVTKSIAAFALLSWILNGVATFLVAIGDQVPGWLGNIISGIGSVTHFLNGVVASSSNPAAPPAA